MPKPKESPPSHLSGKTAVITGGAGELCGAMADALARAGVSVAVIDVDGKRAAIKAEGIVAAGGRAIGIAADVVSRPAMDAAAARIASEFGGLDILINGAGGNNPGATTSDTQSFFELSTEAVRKVFELNCLGTIVPCQALGGLIVDTVKKSGGFGHIINLSSMNALRPLTRIPAYSAAKAAVSNFTQWLAVHMAQNYTPKVRVNAIAPGFFLTNQNRFLLIDQASGGFTARGQTILLHTPAGELGRAEDLLSTLFWLLDPASRFISGVVVPVDGAFSAFSGV